ncbi:MAG: hypothetical protein ACUVT1_10330 [Anaerolineae bacterium]
MMPKVPAFLLKKLYVKDSLRSTDDGFVLTIKNTLAPGTITRVKAVMVDGREIPAERVAIGRGENQRPAARITPQTPFIFNLNEEAQIWVRGERLAAGRHQLLVRVTTKEVGDLDIPVEDEYHE